MTGEVSRGPADSLVEALHRARRHIGDCKLHSIERLAFRAALGRRRAIWLTRLIDATVVWSDPMSPARLIVIDNGDVVLRATVDPHATAADSTWPPASSRGTVRSSP
jgi:hypothetical protein